MLTPSASTPGSPLDEARHAHTVTTLIDGRLLVLGGSNVNGDSLTTGLIVDPRPDAFTDNRYDPTAAVVTALGSVLQVPRAGHTATLLPDGKVLIAGGRDGASDLASIELFDPEAASSILVGFVSPGWLAAGEKYLKSAPAGQELARQWSKAVSPTFRAKLEARIMRHFKELAESVGAAAAWQAINALYQGLDDDMMKLFCPIGQN